MNHRLSELQSLGRYKLIRELGRGGMSVVYLAEDTKLEREVAIKCVDLLDKRNANFAERLLTESKLLAKFNHPNVVQLYDVIEQNDILGLVMESVGGTTLTQRLKQAPSQKIRLRWLAEIAKGLASAHERGIAHCDLKTDNVLITSDNTAKVADFGIAKVRLDDHQLRTDSDGRWLSKYESDSSDSITGSYFSLSPEQALGQPIDTRTDLFSFATLSFIALTGKHPFADLANKAQLVQRLLNEPPAAHYLDEVDLDPRLINLLTNLLSKEPSDRLYSAKEAAELLEGQLSEPASNLLPDHTTKIPTQPRRASSSKPIDWWALNKKLLSKALFIGAGFICGIIALRLIQTPDDTEFSMYYVALDEVKLTLDADVQPESTPLLRATITQAAEESLLSMGNIGLIKASEMSDYEGAYQQKAKFFGARHFVSVSAHCGRVKCDLELGRFSGKRMALKEQATFPVAVDSLVRMRHALFNELPKLFGQSVGPLSQSQHRIDEEGYRKYLQLHLASDFGFSTDPKYLIQVAKLIKEHPSFSSAYVLLANLAEIQTHNTGDESHLLVALETIEDAPQTLREDATVEQAKIQTLLELGRIEDAKEGFVKFSQKFSNKQMLSDLESVIAEAENDYVKLLKLDRQNAVWRPSIANLFTLAGSEFKFGDRQKAKSIIENLLEQAGDSPEPFLLEAKALVELNMGDLDTALDIFKKLSITQESSDLQSKLGIALAFDGQYQEAIQSHLKSIEIAPNIPVFYVNLADTYQLSGQTALANNAYQKVIDLIEAPQSHLDYSCLAQAHAQLGEYKQAISTLKEAYGKFPPAAQLEYTSAIVHTLASNYTAALVEAQDSIESGISPIWFSHPWFKPLCYQEDFRRLIRDSNNKLCAVQ